jgi:nuclease-like protein
MTRTASDRTRSPIKHHERGLGLPGESAWQKFYFEAFGDFAFHFGLGCGFAIAAIVLGIAWALAAVIGVSNRIMAGLFVVVALVGIGATIYGWRRLQGQKSWRLGSDGERAVARVLEGLRDAGWFVFHDIFPRENDPWNIDHVLVGPGGIIAVETKTWNKPKRGNIKLVWDGRMFYQHDVKSGQRLPDEHGEAATEQARRNAKTLAEILQNETGRRWTVDAALVFPGWFVVDEGKPGGTSPDLLVRNPKNLAGHCRKRPRRLTPEDVALVRSRLEMMCAV